MKIVLVSPVSKAGNGGFILGLAYISAMLKKHGYLEISGFDLMYQSESDFLEASRDADIVGFYCTTRTFQEVRRLTGKVKENNPEAFVATGGPHPTVVPDEVIRVDSIDMVCIGEGEHTMLEVVRRLETGHRDLSDIPGIVWKKNGQPVRNRPRPVLTDLDSLPFPDWDLFDRSNYYSGLATPIASRSCPYACINCMPALRKIAGPYRRRSVENVVAELKELKKDYGIDHVFFQDNDISVSRNWLNNLCNRLIEEDLKIRWHALCRVNTLDREIIRQMKQAGCVHINIGAESGSQRVIELLNKKIDLEKVRHVVQWCNRERLEVTVFFMIGIPGETLEEMRSTIEFAGSLKADDLMISVAQPVPYTNFEKICRNNNWLLTDDPDDFDTPDRTGGMKCWIKTDQWGPEDIQSIKRDTRKILKNLGYQEIDNKFLFRNFDSIIKKRGWDHVGLMAREEIRKFSKSRKIRDLLQAGYFIAKKTMLSL